MGTTVFMGLVLVAFIAIMVVGLNSLKMLFSNFKPSKNQINKDLDELKGEVQKWVGDLVPWTKEEMELFSLNQINRTQKKGITKLTKGVFTSIYHEPMLAYAIKDYVGKGPNALLYAKTAKHEFMYRIDKDGIKVVVDNEMIGTLNAEGQLLAPRGRKMLAQVNKNSEALALPVVINKKEVGRIVNQNKVEHPNPRAFDLLDSNINEEEEKLFSALAVLELVQQQELA